MADTDKSKETKIKTDTGTEAASKQKSKTSAEDKPKAKAKAKPKPKAKPKAETKDKPKAKKASKTGSAEVAPYKSKPGIAASSQAQKPKKTLFTTLIFIAILAIVVITTSIQLNKQMSEQSAQTDSHENTATTKSDDVSEPVNTRAVAATPTDAPVAETQAEPSNFKETSAVTEAPGQDVLPADQAPLKQAETQAQVQERVQDLAQSANHLDTMQQRRQKFEKRMQLKKQEYEAIIEMHQKERAKLAAEQNDLMLRIRQKNQQTKLKVDQIRQQIYELHQQINQIMRESSQVQRQP